MCLANGPSRSIKTHLRLSINPSMTPSSLQAEFHLTDFMDESEYPLVDIILPCYKEPWQLYRTTVQSALDLHYPAEKLTVWVLDDGRHDPLQQRLQVSYSLSPAAPADLRVGHAARVGAPIGPLQVHQRLKRSSEAAGNTSAFPASAWANIAIVVCFTIFYGVLMIPGCNVIHQSTGYIVLGSQVFMAWFANWVSGFCLLLSASLA